MAWLSLSRSVHLALFLELLLLAIAADHEQATTAAAVSTLSSPKYTLCTVAAGLRTSGIC